MMLWGYFDCCCCVTNNPRTCCKETTFLFCSSPWGTELQEGLHWIDLLCGLPRLHWDVGLICHYLKDCGWTRYESQMEAVTWELGHVQGMLQHSGPWNGKLLSWWSSFARLSVPMEAGGRCMAFIMKAWKLVISVIALLVKAVTTPGVGIRLCSLTEGASLVAQLVKNLHANADDTRDMGSIPGLGRSPGEGYGNHFFTTNCSGILGWKIPWPELPGGLQFTGSQSQTGPSARAYTHSDWGGKATLWRMGDAVAAVFLNKICQMALRKITSKV